jgi:hypothetical protein
LSRGRIEIERWVPDPEKPGCLKYAGNRTVQEVFAELKKRLEQEDLLPDEYFSVSAVAGYENRPFPDHRWLACYVVSGASEGHYIHVDAMLTPRERPEPLFVGKTFRGFDFATRVANACAKHLRA